MRAIRQPGALRAGLAVYEEYFTSAGQVARHAERALDIPVVGYGGEACLGGLTLATVQAVAPKATGGVVERSGHWMPEERPDVIIEQALALANTNGVATGHRSVPAPPGRSTSTTARERSDGVSSDLISRAQSGDGEAFRALTEPYRRELHVHCYRMLGSIQDAEDALQDTLMAAWRGLAGLAAARRSGPGSIGSRRTRVSTRSAPSGAGRPRRGTSPASSHRSRPVAAKRSGWGLIRTPSWPAPTTASVGPEARYEQSESISLAFVTALQLLPPRQLAVMVLRDVLAFHAAEVAEMLARRSVGQQRTRPARASLAQRQQTVRRGEPALRCTAAKPGLPRGSPQESPSAAGRLARR